MSEDGTAVAESQETKIEMSPGGLLTKGEYDSLMEGIENAAPKDEPAVAEAATGADSPAPEPNEATPAATLADEPSRETALATESTEPEVSEPAEPAEDKADEESPATVFDDQLLARAEQMGFSKQTAETFGTPDKLETALTVLDQRLIGMAMPKQAATPTDIPGPEKPAPPPVVQAPPVQSIADELAIDLNPDDHDPAIVEQFKKLNAHYEARANQFQQAFVELLTNLQKGQQRSEQQAVNQVIDGLNGDMKGLMTPEIRAQIYPTAVALHSALSQSGLPLPSTPELVRRATRSLMADDLLKNEHKRATDEISAKLENRASQRTARPVQHHSAEPGLSSEEKQKKDVQDIDGFMRERKMR